MRPRSSSRSDVGQAIRWVMPPIGCHHMLLSRMDPAPLLSLGPARREVRLADLSENASAVSWAPAPGTEMFAHICVFASPRGPGSSSAAPRPSTHHPESLLDRESRTVRPAMPAADRPAFQSMNDFWHTEPGDHLHQLHSARILNKLTQLSTNEKFHFLKKANHNFFSRFNF